MPNFSLQWPPVREGHRQVQRILQRINNTDWKSDEEEFAYLRTVLGALGQDCVIFEPMNFVVGKNLFIGNSVFINSGIDFIDAAPITIGDHTMIAPGCVITTVGHPLSAKERRGIQCYAEPITIGHDVWIGANCTVFPGVTIGDNVIVGANSVVNRDVPSNCVVAGSPIRLIRTVRDDLDGPQAR